MCETLGRLSFPRISRMDGPAPDAGLPPVLKRKSAQPLKPKPVNNARADKLQGFMWRYSFQEQHCHCLMWLCVPMGPFGSAIPVTASAWTMKARGRSRNCPATSIAWIRSGGASLTVPIF